MVRHRLSLLAQQVPVVQAGVRIVNQNARKKQTPPKRVKCGCVEDACHIRGGEGFLPRRVSYSSGS
ncbi:hypothetical protein [Escherichia coli]|uniref:hypothetical protein n=1 Tax=Escherichia coli TaxID=562 RepID=UPI00338ED6CF